MENVERNVKFPNAEFISPDTGERLKYFVASDIFPEDEYESRSFIDKYNLDARYRDYKLVKPNGGFPPGFPTETLKPDADGYILMISIRAMHRIVCKDILDGKNIHFMFDGYLQWAIFDYDNYHGLIIKSVFNKGIVNIKMEGSILFNNQDGKSKMLLIDIFHMDTLWNLDNRPGVLIYYFDPNDKSIASVYIDEQTIEKISLIWKKV